MVGGRHKGLSLVELLVAIGLMAMVIVMAGVVFRIAVQTTRLARANAEVLQRLRVITQQLDADLRGLYKQGEVFIGYVARRDPNAIGGHRRLDRMMFFTTGGFRSAKAGLSGAIYGQVARVGYLLSEKTGDHGTLVRFQHVLTSDISLPIPVDPNTTGPGPWQAWARNALFQYDRLTIQQWMQMPYPAKRAAILGMMGVDIESGTVDDRYGPGVDPADPCSRDLVLSDLVSQFKVQAWSERLQRWVPEIDPDGDGSLVDCDLFASGNLLDEEKAGYVFFTTEPTGRVWFGHGLAGLAVDVPSADFYDVPGLGKALKFTLTIHDSKGLIKGGRTFTYVVYLDR